MDAFKGGGRVKESTLSSIVSAASMLGAMVAALIFNNEALGVFLWVFALYMLWTARYEAVLEQLKEIKERLDR